MMSRRVLAVTTAVILSATATATAVPANAAQSEALPESSRPYLYFQSFDGVDNPAHFTHDLPEGWMQNVEGVTSGEARWNGWTISNMRHWTWAAGTDQRH